ncbi:MAG TPA: GNAT family protein [Phototrophicaceae bacterium]|nr:GNAT family protein [Phototrophicaceae bacterium]
MSMSNSPIPFQSPITGVTIRKAVPDDAARLVAYVGELVHEPENGMLQTPAELRNEDQERQRIEEYNNLQNALIIVAIRTSAANEDEIVGMASYHGGRFLANQHSAMLGISIHRDFRNRGLGTAMMQVLIDYARSSGVIKRLDLGVFAYNDRAFHVYQKLGFQLEGTQRSAFFLDGQYVDCHMMSLLFFEE